ncbi:MAG: hypothetical protein ACYS6K_16870 [Planctomycetota bacterium]
MRTMMLLLRETYGELFAYLTFLVLSVDFQGIELLLDYQIDGEIANAFGVLVCNFRV